MEGVALVASSASVLLLLPRRRRVAKMRMKSKFVNISYVPYALDIIQLLCMRLQIGISNFIWHYTKIVLWKLSYVRSCCAELRSG